MRTKSVCLLMKSTDTWQRAAEGEAPSITLLLQAKWPHVRFVCLHFGDAFVYVMSLLSRVLAFRLPLSQVHAGPAYLPSTRVDERAASRPSQAVFVVYDDVTGVLSCRLSTSVNPVFCCVSGRWIAQTGSRQRCPLSSLASNLRRTATLSWKP